VAADTVAYDPTERGGCKVCVGTHERPQTPATGLDRPGGSPYHAAVLARAFRQLNEQLPARPLARAGAIAYLIAGAVVAVLVPIFFAVMLWGVLTGQG